MSRVPGSIRAEAERRHVSPARVQRERARGRTVDPAPSIDPEQARQIHFLGRVLGLSPSTIAGHVGITEAAVVKALAAPALRL